MNQPLPFVLFGPAHWAAMACVAAALAALVLWLRGAPADSVRRLAVVVAVALVAQELLRNVVWAAEGRWSVRANLPLHLCGLSVFLTAVLLLTRRQVLFDLMYVWGLGGAPWAILTPDLRTGFPSFDYFQIFFGHALIVGGVLIALLGFQMRPSWRGLWRTFLITNVYTLFVFGLNFLLDSNYMYLRYKSSQASLLDFLGPWPWYIVGLELLGLGISILLYLPFALRDRRRPARRRRYDH